LGAGVLDTVELRLGTTQRQLSHGHRDVRATSLWLSLNCLIHGEDQEKMFTIEIEETKMSAYSKS
jgi:hypothetical protein